MARYLTLLNLFWRNSLQTALEYRMNFVVSAVQSTFWLIWGVVSILVFFQYTGEVGGWTLPQMLLVIGLFRIFEGLIDGVLRPNVTRLVEHLRKGTLDFVLLKPVDSQFMASLREFNLMTLPDFVTGSALIIYGLVMMQYMPSLLQFAAFVLMFICGAIIAYGLWMLLVTTAFWFVRVENMIELLTAIYDTGRFPISAFNTVMRLILTFIIPIAFMTTFPAAALIGKLENTFLIIAPIIAIVMLTASRLFWRFALRFYTSASS